MIAVIFEVIPAQGQMQAYLDHAASLRDELQQVPGFISVERFQSLTNPDKLLSLSFFETEDAVMDWRNRTAHRDVQSAGRNGVFQDYHLRVTHVLRDYGLTDRDQAPDDSKVRHKT